MRARSLIVAVLVVAAASAGCKDEQKAKAPDIAPVPAASDAGTSTQSTVNLHATDATCALLSAEEVSRIVGTAIEYTVAVAEAPFTPPGVSKPTPAASCEYRLQGERASEGVRVRIAPKGAQDLLKRIEPRTERVTESVPWLVGENLGFEAGTDKTLPDPWDTGQFKSFESVRDCEVAVEGACSFRVRTTGTPQTGGFTEDTIPVGGAGGGYALQCVQAGDRAGSTVTLSGRIQTDLEAGAARVFVYTALRQGYGPFVESDPVSGTGRWTTARATLELPRDRDVGVCVGGYSDGEGSAWFDGLRLSYQKNVDLPDGVKMLWQAEGRTLWITKGDKVAAVQVTVERGLTRPALDIARELGQRILPTL